MIVSMGPRGDDCGSASGCTARRFLPQAAIVPQCDLVITHGGNSTVGEALHHGYR